MNTMCINVMHTLHKYVHDPEQRREDASSRALDTRCVDRIQHTLANINPFARGLRQLGQEPAEDVSLHVEWKDESSEIGAIIHRGDSSGGPRTVVYWKRSELAPTFISPLDRLYEPLQYPLFFPHGCCGWFPGLTSTRPPYQRVTQREYYRQRLLSEPRFGLLGRLLNEYLVDMFSSVEDNRLNYVREHVQSRIAARRELDETIEAEGGARAGRVYLPASFMGSPRMQRRLIADGLAVVRRLGKPTYFITVTCNPNWPEIRNHPELHRQNASDRPDLTCRIFRAKLTHLVDALRRGLLGRKVYLMYVVEFQKRGLPHAHLALRVTPQPQTSDDIDDIVSAEVPPVSSEADDQRYRELVLRHMVHHHTQACRDDEGRCRKKFPKPIVDRTHTDDRGYVHYRRRTAADTYVVPHNRHLLLLCDSHVNVEVSCTVNLIMYLYKYIFKGPDRARYEVGDVVDEIHDYIQARYVYRNV